MSIIENFSLDSIKFNLKVKSSLNFNDLLWRYLKILNYARPYVTFFEIFASNRPFICKHNQTIKR